MPRLEEQENKKLYFFRSHKSNKKLQKYSGDEVSNQEISEFEIPDFLLEKLKRNDDKERKGIRENPSNKINRETEKGF